MHSGRPCSRWGAGLFMRSMECLRAWKCNLSGGSFACRPYFLMSQSRVLRLMGSPRLLKNRTGESSLRERR